MAPRLVAVMLVLWVPLGASADAPEKRTRTFRMGAVRLLEQDSPVYGHGFQLRFEALPPEPALARLSASEVREALAQWEYASREPGGKPAPWRGEGPAGLVLVGASAPGYGETWLRERYQELYGEARVPLTEGLEKAKWMKALLRSPRYMGGGVREAAVEMFNSRTLAMSVALAMLFYVGAWAAPEPVFTKAMATAVTIGLLMTYSVAELHNVGVACLNLYREAEAARREEQIEAAAEHFGRTIGGVGLRVLLTLGTANLSSGLPRMKPSGLWARLSPPRWALAEEGGSLMVGAGSRVEVEVERGTVVLMGVATNTTAQAAVVAAREARTSGACRDASDKGEAKEHHIATNKNNTSEIRGGPWTPKFEDFFARAGMGLEDTANKVYLLDHQGPHPEEYHREVFRRLDEALEECLSQDDCQRKLSDALDRLAADICKLGSKLNRLATGRP